jgi:hypothetical protein
MSEKYRFEITYDDWTIKDVISSYENVHMYNFKNAKNELEGYFTDHNFKYIG